MTSTIPHLVLSDLTLAAVQAEATRAHLKHGENSMLGPSLTDGDRLAILTEEIGEVAREMNDFKLGDPDDPGDHLYRMVAELIQVAAMACTWVQQLEGTPANGDVAP